MMLKVSFYACDANMLCEPRQARQPIRCWKQHRLKEVETGCSRWKGGSDANPDWAEKEVIGSLVETSP